MSDIANERALKLESALPRLMRAMYRPNGDDPLSELPVAQLRVVRLLFTESKTHSAVGDELGISLSAVTQMANRLEQIGLIERIEDQNDRRVKFLRLTPTCKEVMTQRQQRRVARIKEVLATLQDDEQAVIIDSIEKLVAASRGNVAQDRDSAGVMTDFEHSEPKASPATS